MVRHGGSIAGSYLANPTSLLSPHYAVIILFISVPVHQLSSLALQELIVIASSQIEIEFCVVY